ncbi:MAG: YdiU family protein [Bacteroidota bacterium]
MNDIKPKHWNWDHTYRNLPEQLFSLQQPNPVREPSLQLWNDKLAADLGLSFLNGQEEEITTIFSGNKVPEGAVPLAQAYAGHQFGYFNTLGDGRAILFGEQITPTNKRVDIQLKGSGRTPYSRRGDGRATLSSMLREYIISEAMYHLGIPSTRSLAVVATGEQVYRQPIQDGAVLTRIAASHIRVGTFEYVLQNGSKEDLQAFLDYVIDRHYPELKDAENPAIALLEKVIEQQIKLVTEWMRVGFIHGVMNTDNVSIAGETIDYGPCAFMNAYDPKTVFSSIDRDGRYAFGNQPKIAHWNMVVFAGTLLPLISDNEEEAASKARAVLDDFPRRFGDYYYRMLLRKLGVSQIQVGDKVLVDELLYLLEHHAADYTNFFVSLTTEQFPVEPLYTSAAFEAWHASWKRRLSETGGMELAKAVMQANNPAFIPRNHIVEAALQAAVNGDYDPFHVMLAQVATPYKYDVHAAALQAVPAGFDSNYQTFCGT